MGQFVGDHITEIVVGLAVLGVYFILVAPPQRLLRTGVSWEFFGSSRSRALSVHAAN